MSSFTISASKKMNAGQNVSATHQLPAGTGLIKMEFPYGSDWTPNTDMANISIDVSYDGQVTWQALGGITVSKPSVLTDLYLGTLAEAYIQAPLPQPAGSNTFGRVKANILQSATYSVVLTIS